MNKETLRFVCLTSRVGQIHCQVQTRASLAEGILLEHLVMHEMESLTQSLEDVVQEPIDWLLAEEPAKGDGAGEGRGALVLLLQFDRTCLVSSARLQFPAFALPLLSTWRIARSKQLIDVHWCPVECTLSLCTLSLSPSEQRDLRVGALLIIPESFHPVWKATLEVGEAGLVLPGCFECANDTFVQNQDEMVAGSVVRHDSDALQATSHSHMDSRRIIPTSSQEDALGASSDDVYRVQVMCVVAAEALMRPEMPTSVDVSTGKYTVERWCRDRRDRCFLGSLFPIGSGQALFLESAAMPGR